jgi:predicted PurR-regulated permease PerM
MSDTTVVQAPPAARPSARLLAIAIFVGLLLWLAYSIADILFLFFIAVLFSLYLGMITDFLQERFHLPRSYGLAIALLGTFAGVVALGWLIVPAVLQQTRGLVETLPHLVAGWEASLLGLADRSPLLRQMLPKDTGGGYIGSIVGRIGGYFAGMVPYVFSGVAVLIHLVGVLVMAIYMTLRPDTYREGVITLVPPVHRDLANDVAHDLARVLRAWIGGQLLSMLVLTLLTWAGLLILGVPYALAFAVFTGLAAIVPFFGTLISTLVPALFMVGAAGLGPAMLVVLLGLVIHLIEGNLVHPLIMARQVHLPPVLSILGVLVMAKLLGVIGLLVAVPVLATVMVVVRRIYVQRILEGAGFRRSVRPRGSAIPELVDSAEKLPSRIAKRTRRATDD